MGNRLGRLTALGGALVLAALFGMASPAAANSSWGWGDNESGDVGNNSAYEQRVPVAVHVLPTSIVGVAAGGAHSLAFGSGGSLWAWGDNVSGQVGDNTLIDRYEPVQVTGISGVVEASGGYLHSLARKSNGTVWAWGDNSYGQLGDNTITDRLKPVQVHALTLMVAVAAGGYHSLALESDGTAWAWGLNDHGQLGDNSALDRHEPVQVHTVSGVVAIAAGAAHSLAAQSDGTVWAWGDNSSGQLGDNSATDRPEPVQVHVLTDIVAVAAGGGHSLALKGDGTVWAWGENLWGQLGDGSASDRHEPVQVRNLTNVTAIAAGDSFSLALKSDGTLWAWGHNGYGQIGDNSIANRLEPVQVSTLTTCLAIGAGGAHALAVTGTGLPDLQGCGCNAPRSAFWGQTINVTCQVQNVGTVSSNSFRVQWVLSQDPVGSGVDDILLPRSNGLDYYAHNGIAAKATGTAFTVALQLPAAIPSGWTGTKFYVIMATDTLNAIVESNEANNFGQMGNGLDRDPIVIGTAVPEVTFPTLPNELWLRGQSYTISWQAFVSTNVKVELYKGGVLNRTLTSSMGNTGSLAWTVPTTQAIGDDYAIQVTAAGNPALTDSSDNPLTIADPKVTYPTAAGVAWLGGKAYTITWSGFPDATVNVDLYKAGVLNQSLGAGTPNSGSVGWAVPLGQAAGTDYTVVVSSPTNPDLTATSGQPFTIGAPQVTSPTAAGLIWLGGTSHAITWLGFPGTNVKIDLYKGASLSRTIVNSTSNTGSLLWVVPTTQAAGFDYTIKVTSTANSAVTDASDNPFTIATPKVTYPTAAGVKIQAGKVMTVKWSGYPGATVKIETYQGATLADTPSGAATNNGSFAYTVPKSLTPGTGYTIKITSTADGTLSDSSDNPFTITP